MNVDKRPGHWLVGLVAAPCVCSLPHAAAAEKAPKVWHVALCHVGLDHEPPGLYTLHKALNDMGYVDGKNLRFDWRNQADAAAAAATIKEWVAARVDVLVGFEDQCVSAAKAATSTIPIVFVQIYDPQAAGFIQSLAHPGGNLTGPVANLKLLDKRLQLLKEIDPKAERILVLYDGRDPYSAGERALARKAAAPLKLTIVERDAGTEADVKRVFADLNPGEVDAVIVASPHLQTNHPRLILELSEDARLPVVGHREAWVDWGALLSYSTDGDSAGPVAARYMRQDTQGCQARRPPGRGALHDRPRRDFQARARARPHRAAIGGRADGPQGRVSVPFREVGRGNALLDSAVRVPRELRRDLLALLARHGPDLHDAYSPTRAVEPELRVRLVPRRVLRDVSERHPAPLPLRPRAHRTLEHAELDRIPPALGRLGRGRLRGNPPAAVVAPFVGHVVAPALVRTDGFLDLRVLEQDAAVGLRQAWGPPRRRVPRPAASVRRRSKQFSLLPCFLPCSSTRTCAAR